MAFLGGFMGGQPDYNQNPGILGLYQFVQSGYDAGKARAQNDALRQLSQKAYTDTGDAQQQDIAQMVGIDPQAGYQVSAMAQQQQARQQAQKLAQLQRLGKGASAIVQAVQNGDTTAAQGIYQAMLPDIRLASAQHGGPEPTGQLDQAALGNMTKLAAIYGQLPKQDAYTLTPGSKRYNGQNQEVASVAAQPKITPQGYQAVLGPDGTYHAAQIPIQGAQNGMGVGATVQGAGASAAPQAAPGFQGSATSPSGRAVTFNFPPGTPPEVIAAAQASAVANGDLAPGQQVGAPQAPAQTPQQAPQTLAQVIAAQKAGTGSNLIGQRAQQIQELKARGVQMTPEDEQAYLTTGKMGSDFQGGSSAALFGDPTLSGPKYLQSIPQGNQEIVRGLLDGTVSLPTGTTLKSPLWQSALASVKHADPAWNQAAYKQYADTRKWATTGQGGQLINNINTAAYHLDKLREDIQALNNGNFSLLNAAGNAISKGTGGQAVTNFNADLTPVASELAAVYKGKGVPSDAEIAHFMNALTPNMSQGQQMNVIRGWIDLLAGKLNSTREQYQSGMSKLSSPLSVINPHAAEALERITTLANQMSNTGQRGMPQEDTTPIYAPGQQPAPAAGGAKVSTQAQYDALPSGATYTNANDGQTYRKP